MNRNGMKAKDVAVDYLQETAAIVWHMGAFGLDARGLEEYHAAIRRFPRAIILTHAADHLASVTEGGAE